MSMQRTLGGCKPSFLALTASPTVYATLSPTQFVNPPNQGPTLAIPPNATSIKENASRHKFTLEMGIYMLHQNMDKALKQHLLGVMEDIYSRYLKKNK